MEGAYSGAARECDVARHVARARGDGDTRRREGSLSFLGLGVPPPTPSWGGMLAAGRESLREYPHLVLIPMLFFFLTVYSFNKLGDWVRGRVGKESSV